MITISEILKNIVFNTPFLEEGLAREIINLSALARKIKPQIEEELLKEVSEAAILMALRRLAGRLIKKTSGPARILGSLGDITIRSNLCEFTFLNSDSILDKQRLLLQEIENRRDKFLTFTQGLFEITIIVNSSFQGAIERIFKKEKKLSKLTDLSAITMHLPEKAVHLPGVHYAILKQLAWHNINVIEEVSTYTEYTIILEKGQVDRAFAILNRWGAAALPAARSRGG